MALIVIGCLQLAAYGAMLAMKHDMARAGMPLVGEFLARDAHLSALFSIPCFVAAATLWRWPRAGIFVGIGAYGALALARAPALLRFMGGTASADTALVALIWVLLMARAIVSLWAKRPGDAAR